LAASIKKQFGVDAELIRGKSGVFDVHLDGTLIFSKHELNRFPEPGEVERLIQERRGSR
jgi:selT/selW/selH-like putative selenoprotein